MKLCKNCINEKCVAKGKSYNGLSCPNYKSMTNADKIRAMSDEELAEFLSCNEKNLEIRVGLKRGILDWLQSEVEE